MGKLCYEFNFSQRHDDATFAVDLISFLLMAETFFGDTSCGNMNEIKAGVRSLMRPFLFTFSNPVFSPSFSWG